MAGKKSFRETFAQMLKKVPLPSGDGDWEEYSSVLWEPSFTDDEGVFWRKRGGKDTYVEGKALQRLLLDSDTAVLHEYFGRRPPHLTVVPVEERAAFWQGALAAMAESEHSDFYGAEFVSLDHRHLVVVHEDC
jgi:hypothetical protein